MNLVVITTNIQSMTLSPPAGADLQRDRSTVWSGVTNNLALQHLRKVRVGDRILFYHTGKEKVIAGEMRALKDAGPDPQAKNPKLDAELVKVAKAAGDQRDAYNEAVRAMDVAYARKDAHLGKLLREHAVKEYGLENILFLEAASAKIRCSEAAEKGGAIAHQVHGAIGFTTEHILHRYSLRALAWRDDFGNESFWAVELGKLVAARGADELWPLVASR